MVNKTNKTLQDRLGVYEIKCKDCHLKYYGQKRRAIETRFKEHLARMAEEKKCRATLISRDRII